MVADVYKVSVGCSDSWCSQFPRAFRTLMDLQVSMLSNGYMGAKVSVISNGSMGSTSSRGSGL